MRNISKLVIAAACFFAALTMSNVSNAQLKDTTRQKNKQTIDLSKMPATMTGGVFFYNKDNMIKATDSVQIGTEITVISYWIEKCSFLKSVFTDPVKYEPTPEEIKNRQYSFTIKPERTTTYKYKWFQKNGKVSELTRTIKVVDKNGKEIK